MYSSNQVGAKKKTFLLQHSLGKQGLVKPTSRETVLEKLVKEIALTFSNIEKAGNLESFKATVCAHMTAEELDSRDRLAIFLSHCNSVKVETMAEEFDLIVENLGINEIVEQGDKEKIKDFVVSSYKEILDTPVCDNKKDVFKERVADILGKTVLNSALSRKSLRPR